MKIEQIDKKTRIIQYKKWFLWPFDYSWVREKQKLINGNWETTKYVMYD